MMTKTLFASIALILATPALADLCKYEDDQGNITYSDTAVKGARKLSCLGPVPVPPPPPPANTDERAAQPVPGASSPADARRDALRARLAQEEERLRVAQDELTQQEAIRMGDERNYQRVLDRLKPYQEAVRQAEQALEATRKELATPR